MGLYRITFGLQGEKPMLDRAIPGVMELAKDMRGAWVSIVQAFYAYMSKRFQTEGSHDGGQTWAPLSDDYAAWKLGRRSYNEAAGKVVRTGRSRGGQPAIAPGATILRLRSWPSYCGRLPRSPNLMESLRQDGPENVTRILPQELTMGSKLLTPDGRYNLGMLHQRGTSRMPRRPVIWLGSAIKRDFMRIIRLHLTEQLIDLGEARGRTQ